MAMVKLEAKIYTTLLHLGGVIIALRRCNEGGLGLVWEFVGLVFGDNLFEFCFDSQGVLL